IRTMIRMVDSAMAISFPSADGCEGQPQLGPATAMPPTRGQLDQPVARFRPASGRAKRTTPGRGVGAHRMRPPGFPAGTGGREASAFRGWATLRLAGWA